MLDGTSRPVAALTLDRAPPRFKRGRALPALALDALLHLPELRPEPLGLAARAIERALTPGRLGLDLRGLTPLRRGLPIGNFPSLTLGGLAPLPGIAVGSLRSGGLRFPLRPHEREVAWHPAQDLEAACLQLFWQAPVAEEGVFARVRRSRAHGGVHASENIRGGPQGGPGEDERRLAHQMLKRGAVTSGGLGDLARLAEVSATESARRLEEVSHPGGIRA